MRILYTTDLHGAQWKYDRLLSAAGAHQADIVINGGDLLPKQGSPFHQNRFITEYLDQHFSLFHQAGILYLCFLGNDDLRIFDGLFDEICQKYPSVFNLAQKRVSISGVEFIGMNWVVDYPFRLKDRCRVDTSDYIFQEQYGTGLLSTPQGWQEIVDWPSYAWSLPSIKEELDRLVTPDDPFKTVYIIHMPPSDLGLDKCGHGPEVGSKAVYRFLERMQPMFSLHGHIHESPETSGKWFGSIGRTICIQPGQLDPFTYVTVDLDTKTMNRYTTF